MTVAEREQYIEGYLLSHKANKIKRRQRVTNRERVAQANALDEAEIERRVKARLMAISKAQNFDTRGIAAFAQDTELI